MNKRRKTRPVRAGKVIIGGNAPVSVQSMTKTDTRNVRETVNQIRQLQEAGCEIVRVAVPDTEAALKLGEIKKRIKIPLVADIHFNYRLALLALEQGVDKLRLNPGNIGEPEKVAEIARRAKKRGVPIRIGVNAGSLKRHGRTGSVAEMMVESALEHIRILERHKFRDIVISLKASDVLTTIQAYELMAEKVDYPFHLGITEAGTLVSGTARSSIGISALLMRGIGDTIRVSLASSPADEVSAGKAILQSVGLRKFGPEIIVCPTCGRAQIDVFKIAAEVEKKTKGIKKPLKIAVMGCEVNGPGEAKESDIGLAGGKKQGIIFCRGKLVKKVPENRLVAELLKQIK